MVKQAKQQIGNSLQRILTACKQFAKCLDFRFPCMKVLNATIELMCQQINTVCGSNIPLRNINTKAKKHYFLKYNIFFSFSSKMKMNEM